MDREARWAIVHGVTKESDITLNPGLTGLRATSPWFSLDSEFQSIFLILQFVHGRLWDFSASITTSIYSYNLSIYNDYVSLENFD